MTMGLLGAGSIATATAKLAKAFGMRTVALRRNARKPDDTGAYDLIVGPYDGPILPAHKKALLEESDVVVCTLPGTPDTKHFMGAPEVDTRPISGPRHIPFGLLFSCASPERCFLLRAPLSVVSSSQR